MKALLSGAALAAAMLVGSAPAAAAIVVTFVPSATHVNVGDNVTVDMNISGLGTEILRSFDVNMLYDPAVLDNFLVSHQVALQWPGGGVFGPSVFNVGNTGVLDIAADDDATLAASQADDFTVLRFGFNAVGDGATSVNLGLDATTERGFFGLRGVLLDVEVQGTCISVGTGNCRRANVPEPAGYGLAGLALLAAGLTRRARRQETTRAV